MAAVTEGSAGSPEPESEPEPEAEPDCIYKEGDELSDDIWLVVCTTVGSALTGFGIILIFISTKTNCQAMLHLRSLLSSFSHHC